MLPGDDVLTAAVVNATSYGCRFTNNMTGPDDVRASINLWAGIAASTPACPAAANLLKTKLLDSIRASDGNTTRHPREVGNPGQSLSCKLHHRRAGHPTSRV